MDRVTEARLVLHQELKPVEAPPRLVLDDRAPQIDQLPGRRRRCLAGQPLAHDHGDRFLDRRIGPVGNVVEFAAMEFVVEHRRQILGHAGHATRTDRFDPRLLDRVEDRTRLLTAGNEFAMNTGIVTGELQSNGIGMTAHDRGFATALACELAPADGPYCR